MKYEMLLVEYLDSGLLLAEVVGLLVSFLESRVALFLTRHSIEVT